MPVATEASCPGSCNDPYRKAVAAYKQALADYDPLDPEQSRPEPPEIRPWPGNPWCGRCRSRIREQLAELDDLAALLGAAADGHRASPGGERVSGSAEPPSPSRAGDDLDELTVMLSGWEGAYRDLREWPALTRRGNLASVLTTCVAWLTLHLDEILLAPFAADFGTEVMQWHRELTAKSKAGARTLRKPLRCPRCRLLLLTWTEGDADVRCGNPSCHAVIPLAEYENETERVAAALERGEADATEAA